MDKNELIISGEISWSKLQMVNDMPFGTLRMKVDLPNFCFDMKGRAIVVEKPFIWVGMSVNKNKDDTFKKKDQFIIDTTENKSKPYIIISGARITNWKNKDGLTQYNIDVSSGNVSVSDIPVPVINRCTFEGKVKSYEPSGKMSVECSYLSPKENEWKQRLIPVIHTEEFDPSIDGKKILLFGSACGVTPAGENKLYVVAKEIYKI